MVDMLGGSGKGKASETEDERAPLLNTRWVNIYRVIRIMLCRHNMTRM